MASLVFHNVSFAYDSSPDGLFSRLQFGVSEGWTGVIGASGAGKTTLLRLACAELTPRRGHIDRPRLVIYCPQRTDVPMRGFAALLESTEGEAYRTGGASASRTTGSTAGTP